VDYETKEIKIQFSRPNIPQQNLISSLTGIPPKIRAFLNSVLVITFRKDTGRGK
jgi:hypothetical protein